MKHTRDEPRSKRVQVTFTEEQWRLIEKFRGLMGNDDAEIVRCIVLSWLAERVLKPTTMPSQYYSPTWHYIPPWLSPEVLIPEECPVCGEELQVYKKKLGRHQRLSIECPKCGYREEYDEKFLLPHVRSYLLRKAKKKEENTEV